MRRQLPRAEVAAGPQWREMALAGSPSMTPEWASAWADAFGARYGPRPFPHSHGDAVVPLVRDRRRPWRLELLGSRELHEPMDALGDPAAVEAVTLSLAARGECLDLRRVPAESPLVTAVKVAYQRRGAVVVRPAAATPTLEIDESWAEPERHLSKRRRSDLRRAQRRAEALGPVAYDVVTSDDALEDHLGVFVAVEAAGWKSRARTALACQPQHERFFRSYARALATQGQLRLSFLRIGGQVAAAQYAIQRAERLWLLKIGYDESFARCSPGTLLLLRSMACAAVEGARSVEFLGTAEPWTARWTSVERPHVRVLAYGRSLQALPSLAEDGYRFARLGARELRQNRADRARHAATSAGGRV